MPGTGVPRGQRSPHLRRILEALSRRKAGMTVSQMAAFVGMDTRSLQGSLSALRMRGEIVAGEWRGREKVYRRGQVPPPARTGRKPRNAFMETPVVREDPVALAVLLAAFRIGPAPCVRGDQRWRALPPGENDGSAFYAHQGL